MHAHMCVCVTEHAMEHAPHRSMHACYGGRHVMVHELEESKVKGKRETVQVQTYSH